jgi:hypothetical protein
MIAFVGPSSLSLASTVVVFDVKLDFELGTVLDRVDDSQTTGTVPVFKLGSKLVLDIRLVSNLGTVVDRELCTVVLLDIRPCSELGTGLDRGRRTVVVLDIKLGCKL